MTKPPITIDDVGRIVRALAITTKDMARPHPEANLIRKSLIQQLREAVVPDTGGSGRSKAAHERLPLNAAAFTLYENLVGAVRKMHGQGTGRTSIGAPEELLVDWYVEFAIADAQGDLVQAQLDRQHQTLDDWRTRIMDLFHPPERGEIQAACPECGWKTINAQTAEGDIRQYALVMLARPWRDDEDERVSARCRKCNTVWVGESELTELSADLDTDLPFIQGALL